MSLWFPARRLALLAFAASIFAILLLRRAKHDNHIAFKHDKATLSVHNGKGRPTQASLATADGRTFQWFQDTSPSRLPRETDEQVQSKLHQLRTSWAPPAISNHYPPYDRYGGVDYDPNLWEGFDWDHDFYIRNGIKRLKREKPSAAKLRPYLPYPEYNTAAWKKEWHGEYVPCDGARGKLLNKNEDDWVMAYSALPDGFPKPAIGDADVIGIDIGRCFDRYHRLGPYGHRQNSTKRVQDWKKPQVLLNWTEVPWGKLQDQCLSSNRARYDLNARAPIDLSRSIALDNMTVPRSYSDQSALTSPNYHHRTAVLIRTWRGYQFTENDFETIRSMITELSLLSGSEYQAFLLVDIKTNDPDLGNAERRQVLLDENIPREFHSISILWNERILEQMYPKVGDWQVYWHQFMPLQWFSKTFPQFDFVWNWEIDARYTGQHYHFLEQLSTFSKATPRKYLWERNQRFYFPAAHSSYQQWVIDTHASVESAMKSGSIDAVWGPRPYNLTHQEPVGPPPPRRIEDDNYEWGVDEEADLITLQPIWDPTNTRWVFRDKIFNFLPGIRPQFSWKDPLDRDFTHPEFVNIPRRTFINTFARFSNRQLHAMHLENTAGRTMQAEMWPATVALHHGLKAVYAPHPVWTDRKWPGWYIDAVFNADGKEDAKWGAGKDSVYNQDREHNFAGWSWYYDASFPRTLYQRWLGWPVNVGSEQQYPNNPLRVLGGPEFEDKGVRVNFTSTENSITGSVARASNIAKIGGQGRMCLPPMLLHPVKKMFEPEGLSDVDHDSGLSWIWRWLMDRFDIVQSTRRS